VARKDLAPDFLQAPPSPGFEVATRSGFVDSTASRTTYPSANVSTSVFVSVGPRSSTIGD